MAMLPQQVPTVRGYFCCCFKQAKTSLLQFSDLIQNYVISKQLAVFKKIVRLVPVIY